MPYIKALKNGKLTERRLRLEPFIQALATELKAMKDCSHSLMNAGDLNYVISRLLVLCKLKSYAACCEMDGMLDTCNKEFYRKHVGPYEDLKEEENGTVYGPEEEPLDHGDMIT